MSFQTLVLNNVELLGYTHQNNFFGENSFNYSATKTISLKGFVLDLQNYNGAKNIINSVNEITQLAQEFYNIIINNQNYGIGKITSLSFDAGNWVRTTRYNAEIQILTEIPLKTLGSDFANINLTNKNLNLLKSFSETFSLNFDTQNKILGGDHSIDIEYDANNKNLDLIKLAQSLASELLKTLPTSLAEGNYTTRTKYRVLNTEDYDLVNGKCGFKRSFSYKTENTDQPYSLRLNHSIQINENGICSVKESCDIKAEYDIPSLYENALIGLKNQLDNSNPYSRIDTFFQRYRAKFNIQENLNTQFIEKSVKINKFDGTITYDIGWDNDPKHKNADYTLEYTQTLDRDQEGIWRVSENGNIVGNGQYSDFNNQKYQKAETGFLYAKAGIDSRLNSFYNTNAKTKIGNSSLKLLSKSVSRSPYKGEISYNYDKTDDSRIIENDPDNIKKLEIQKSDTDILGITKDFIIPGGTKKYALNQNREFKKQGTFSVKVDMTIGCSDSNAKFNGKKYFDLIKSNKSKYQTNFASTTPGAKENYIESVQFSSDEVEKKVSFEINYKYS